MQLVQWITICRETNICQKDVNCSRHSMVDIAIRDIDMDSLG